MAQIDYATIVAQARNADDLMQNLVNDVHHAVGRLPQDLVLAIVGDEFTVTYQRANPDHEKWAHAFLDYMQCLHFRDFPLLHCPFDTNNAGDCHKCVQVHNGCFMRGFRMKHASKLTDEEKVAERVQSGENDRQTDEALKSHTEGFE